MDQVAAAMQLRTTSIALPFTVSELPDGLAVSTIVTNREFGSADVYLGRSSNALGPQLDFEISLLRTDDTTEPHGEAIDVAGRPAVLVKGTDITVIIPIGGRRLRIGTFAGDTGPYPDRSGDLPLILELARRVAPAQDLDDRSTWIPAENSFG